MIPPLLTPIPAPQGIARGTASAPTGPRTSASAPSSRGAARAAAPAASAVRDCSVSHAPSASKQPCAVAAAGTARASAIVLGGGGQRAAVTAPRRDAAALCLLISAFALISGFAASGPLIAFVQGLRLDPGTLLDGARWRAAWFVRGCRLMAAALLGVTRECGRRPRTVAPAPRRGCFPGVTQAVVCCHAGL
jgi:hypothetical protein